MLTVANLINLILVLVPLLIAVVLHELAHGYAAYKLGDPTAQQAGRLTLNPVKHLDPIGSVILPLFLKLSGSPFVFGWARPVPVNFSRLRGQRGGVLVVAAAGVATNMALALVCSVIYKWLPPGSGAGGNGDVVILTELVRQLVAYSVAINLVLAIFNLIPVPPLDGGRILSVFLPPALRFQLARVERFGIIILLALLLTGSVDWLFSTVLDPLLIALL
jgi:Zn-dependent protease